VLERPVEDRHEASGVERPEERKGKAEQQVETSSQCCHFKAFPIFSDCHVFFVNFFDADTDPDPE